MEEILTVKDLAERWKCTEYSIRKQVNEGILKSINLPGAGIRFRLEYIIHLEGGAEDITIRKYKKLAREHRELEMKYKKLLEIVGNILSESAKITKL